MNEYENDVDPWDDTPATVTLSRAQLRSIVAALDEHAERIENRMFYPDMDTPYWHRRIALMRTAITSIETVLYP